MKNHIKNLRATNGDFSQIGMWKLSLSPKIWTHPWLRGRALKNVYLETDVERLRHRKIKSGFISNYQKKVELWDMRFEYLKNKVTNDWSDKELTLALISLKNNKSRAPSGFINEIFKPPVLGRDLKDALLKFLNGIKREFFFPD